MANGHPKPRHIHPVHHLSKFRAMGRAMPPDIELPLMDHLMRQGSPKLRFRLIPKQGSGQPNHSSRTLSIIT
jgi:hypothetical protein